MNENSEDTDKFKNLIAGGTKAFFSLSQILALKLFDLMEAAKSNTDMSQPLSGDLVSTFHFSMTLRPQDYATICDFIKPTV